MVVISKTSGKALNSIGFSIKIAIINTTQDIVIDKASEISNSQVGIGIIKMTSIRIIATANKISPRLAEPKNISLNDILPKMPVVAFAIAVNYS